MKNLGAKLAPKEKFDSPLRAE